MYGLSGLWWRQQLCCARDWVSVILPPSFLFLQAWDDTHWHRSFRSDRNSSLTIALLPVVPSRRGTTNFAIHLFWTDIPNAGHSDSLNTRWSGHQVPKIRDSAFCQCKICDRWQLGLWGGHGQLTVVQWNSFFYKVCSLVFQPCESGPYIHYNTAHRHFGQDYEYASA
jgi:hypothetical protein